MKFPYLSQWDNAKCKVYITADKPSVDGEFEVLATYEGGCNLSEKARTVRAADGSYVRLASTIHIKGDIAPGLETFSGRAVVNKQQLKIETVDRPRNPDGTVHHTRLGLI